MLVEGVDSEDNEFDNDANTDALPDVDALVEGDDS